MIEQVKDRLSIPLALVRIGQLFGHLAQEENREESGLLLEVNGENRSCVLPGSSLVSLS